MFNIGQAKIRNQPLPRLGGGGALNFKLKKSDALVAFKYYYFFINFINFFSEKRAVRKVRIE